MRLKFVNVLSVGISAEKARILNLGAKWRRVVTLAQSSKLLLALASTVIPGSESRGTQDHILFPDGSGSLQH
jgi:hypothetical protein